MRALRMESGQGTDTFSESVPSFLERKVRGWLAGVIDDMRRHSPVQQWLDSLPPEADISATSILQVDEKQDEVETSTDAIDQKEYVVDDTPTSATTPAIEAVSAPVNARERRSPESALAASTPLAPARRRELRRDRSLHSDEHAPRHKNPLLRDYSLQSDGSGSSGSSVLNVLGARRVDAESLLIALGFGPSELQQHHQRIPQRFLGPSKLKGISTEQFIQKEQHSMRVHDCGVFGYRGLTEHCTPVCRFMRPVSPAHALRCQIPQVALQESSCTAVKDSC